MPIMNTKIKKLHLTKAEKMALDELMADVRKSWPEARFKLFGSKASGAADPESDLDLFIELEGEITDTLRRQIVHKAFEINLVYESNISVFIVAREEWERGLLTVLPIHAVIEHEGIPL
jgi:predicted nucleotidyltransferase